MPSRLLLIVFSVFVFGTVSQAQIEVTEQGYTRDSLTLNRSVPDTLPQEIIQQDTISPGPADLPQSSSTNESPQSTRAIFAESSLDKELEYGSVDSAWYDNKDKLKYLYGDAFVKYGDKELKADMIILNMEDKIAEAITDKRFGGKKPTFVDAGKEYKYGRLKYNFETEKGIVYDAITTEGEFIVHGEKTKYVGEGGDAFSDHKVIYNANSLITTCNHDNPHFGFKAKKLKVIPDKVAVSGPANLQIAGVPTPLWIPFGFFPLTDGTSTGLIFPQGYQFHSKELGFGLSGFGWYFPINDYVHTRVTGTYYTKGTFGVRSITDYRVRYKYSGSLNFSYDNIKQEAADGLSRNSRKSFSIRYNHRQDNKAHPYISVNGDISIVGNDNNNRLRNDAQSVLTNVYTSNFKYVHKMPRTPFTFTLALNHNQNRQTRKVNFTLPDITLNMQTVYPFKRKNAGGNKETWYEKIALTYGSKMRTYTTTTDTTIFKQETLDNLKSGIQHDLGLSTTIPFMKYISINPSINYDETWVANAIEKSVGQTFTTTPVPADTILGNPADTIITFVDTLLTNTFKDFSAYRSYDAGVTLNTTIFGTKTFKRGPLRGVRHLMKPNVRFSYAPDRSHLIDTLVYNDGVERLVTYSKFSEGPFGTPRFSELRSQISYGVGNTLEIKYFSRKDSTEKKVKIFDDVTFSGSKNFAADSLKWNNHTLRSRTRLFGGITTLTSNWTMAPYLKKNNRPIATTVWEDSKKLLRLESGNIALSSNISFRKLREKYDKSRAKADEDSSTGDELKADPIGENLGDYRDDRPENGLGFGGNELADFSEGEENEDKKNKLFSLWDIFDAMTLRHEWRYTFTSDDNGVQSQVSTHTLNLDGGFDLTENWNVRIGNMGYDFRGKGLTYASFVFSRKLHCWNMSIAWFPSRNNTYQFGISVNSNTLGFLKYDYGQNNTDGFFNQGF